VAVLSLPVAAQLADQPGIRLIVVGGESRPGEQSLAGPLTAETLRRLSFDVFLMSVGAVSADAGWSEFTLEDAAVKQVGLERARTTTVVADASKLGVRAFASVAPLGAVDRLVTDTGVRDPQLSPAARESVTALSEADVEVVCA
jgi:DeoR/GlpR family transcriptional regulator of sugar metabolism